jgi:hypothetical protein
MTIRGDMARASVLAVVVVAAIAHDSRLLAQGDRARLDGVAALVGGASPAPGVDVILRSDVDLRARMALAGRSTGELPLGRLPAPLLKASLAEIVGEHLLAREARRVQVGHAGASDHAAERVQVVRGAGGEARLSALLDALGAGRDEIDAIAERRALAAAFLRANLEGTTTVSAAELERAWQTEQAPIRPEERDDALRALRARLAREALDRAIARWVGVLTARTTVETYADYDAE